MITIATVIVAVHTFAHLAEEVGTAAGIVIAIGVFFTAYKAVTKVIRWIEDIWLEFKPNGGHSLVDRMKRIDTNVQVNARNNHLIYAMMLKLHDIDPELELVPLLETLETEKEHVETDEEQKARVRRWLR